MIRKKILSTTMALSLAMVISGAITGCGNKSSQNDAVPTMTVAEEVEPTEVTTEVETQTETVVATYEVIPVQMPYSVTVTTDTILFDSPDTVEKITDLKSGANLTVIGEINYDGVPTDYYYVKTEDEVEGVVEGQYLEFNGVLEDSMANVTEVEGGDGEDTEPETTEIEETTVPSTDVASGAETFEPYIMYTNKNCNIRGRASKDSTLLGTYPVNTQVEVIGIEGDWSKLVYDGCIAYIKSSLLSETQTVVKSSGGSGNGGSPTASATPSAPASGTAEDPSIQALREKLKANSIVDVSPSTEPVSSFAGMTDEQRKAEEQKLADYIKEHNVYVQ